MYPFDDGMEPDPIVIQPLLSVLRGKKVWEPNPGPQNRIKNTLRSAGIPVDSTVDLSVTPPGGFDVLVSMPPPTQLTDWLEAAYRNEWPFALLVPVHYLVAPKRQDLFRSKGMSLILLRSAIPMLRFRGGATPFALAWATWGLFEEQLIFYPVP